MIKSRIQIVSFLLACVLLIVTGCTTIDSLFVENQPAEPSPVELVPPALAPAEPTPEESAAQANKPVVDTSVIEYGQPGLLTNNEGPLWTYIRYPKAGNFADGTILDWAKSIQKEAQADLNALLEVNKSAEGEANIHFDSYLVDGRFVGIIEQGIISNTGLAHPADIIKTFNLDIERQAILENSDILDLSKSEQIISLLKEKILLVSPDAQAYFTDATADEWLKHIAIGHEGILVLLERGAGLPSHYSSLQITLPYDELGDALLLYSKTAPTPEPSLEPVPTLVPEPAAPSLPQLSGGIDPSRPMVALTFDDGPSKHTSRILDLLEQYKGHATFFVIGNLVDMRPDTIRRAAGMGSEVAGHSWDHRNLTKLSAEEIKAEILDTHNTIESIAGAASHIYRPPYGAINNGLKGVSQELGFSIIHWSVDTVDWKTKNAEAVYTAVMADVKDRAIILCHDLYGTTADAMERIVPELIAKGYQLVTVSELLAYSGGPAEPGKVYKNGE